MSSPKKTNEMPFGIALFWAVFGAVLLVVLGVFIVPALWIQFAYRPAEADVVDRRWARHPETKGSFYRLEALLEYQVAGQDYQTWVEWPGEAFSRTGPEAEAVFDQVQVGQHVTFYHDPFHPELATADRDRWQWAYLLGLACGALCLLGGVGSLAAAWGKTFPRGVRTEAAEMVRRRGTEAADLIRWLPRRFWLAAAGALLVAGVGFVVLRDTSGWTCLVLVPAAGCLVWLVRLLIRYGAVTLPSAEKRAAAVSPALPPAAADCATPAGWNRAEPVQVERGERLPVRLPHSPAGGCVAVGCGSVLLTLVFLFILLQGLSRTWREPMPAGLRPFLLLMGVALASAVIIGIGWRALRRMSNLTVEVSGHPFQAGGRHELAVSHPNPPDLAGLRMELVCDEQRSRGKSTEQATPVRQPVTLEPPSGKGDVRTGWLEVPSGAPMSFALEHHQVRWCLKVRLGRVPRWRGDCPVTVAPGDPGERPTPAQAGQALRLDEEALSMWIDGDRPVFQAGETLTGGYKVHAQEAAGALQTVELSVLWYAGAAGAGDLRVCHYKEHAAVDGDDLALYAPRCFHVQLPEGPPSYQGKLVQVRWAVRLRLRYVSGAEVLRELPFRFVVAGGTEPLSH
jgi:hypothetical protein